VDATLFPLSGALGSDSDASSRLLVTLRGTELARDEPRAILACLCRALAEAFPVRDVVVHALDGQGVCSLLGSTGAAPLLSPGVENGVAALVASGASYVWLPGEPAAPSRWARVGLSLPRGGRVVGVLSLTVRAQEREFLETLAPALLPFRNLAAAAVERATAAEARHREWLTTLQALSEALAAHEDLDGFLTAALDALVRVTGMEMASVTLVESGSGRLRVRMVRGRLSAPPRLWERFSLGERLEGRAARGRELLSFRGLRSGAEPGDEIAQGFGLDQVLCLPLWRKECLLGILSLGSVQAGELSGEALDLIRAVGRQITVAVDHAVLIEQARRQTEEYRERSDELRVLYDLSQAMVATNSLEDRLKQVARALTRVTGAPHCRVFRREPDGLAPWIGLDAKAEERAPRTVPDLTPEEVRRLVYRSRRGPFVTGVGGRDPFARSSWLQEHGIRAALWLPLSVERRIIGFALCYRPGQESIELSPEQRRLAGAIASQAAMAIRMSQAYEHERSIADRLQSGLRPTHVVRHGRFELESAYHPALQEARVGGDFYDVFNLPDGRVALLMADVSGKGLMAAMQTTMVKNMLRLIAFENAEPAAALGRLNRALFHFSDPEFFVTAFYGVLSPETGALQYANAGHDPPLFYQAQLRFCTALDTTGMALGMDADCRYFGRQIALEQGDLLLLYTDGITEARQGEEFFGRERLEDRLVRYADSRPTRIVRFLYRDARAFSGGALHDDVALLCLKARE
jgi:sigma-B regulation protein RsbU (phosphoserine phosphatase)